MLPLGTIAPDFSLTNAVDGRVVNRDDLKGQNGLLVIFLCNHCPYVKHVAKALAELTAEYQQKGVAIVGISSNDVQAYPDDGPEQMKIEAAQQGYPFAYLFDETQQVAKAYRAACTPDFFLFDRDFKLVYRGQMDDSRPKQGSTPTGRDLRAALDAMLSGQPALQTQRPSLGCNIKWKPGNEPQYFDPAGVS